MPHGAEEFDPSQWTINGNQNLGQVEAQDLGEQWELLMGGRQRQVNLLDDPLINSFNMRDDAGGDEKFDGFDLGVSKASVNPDASPNDEDRDREKNRDKASSSSENASSKTDINNDTNRNKNNDEVDLDKFLGGKQLPKSRPNETVNLDDIEINDPHNLLQGRTVEFEVRGDRFDNDDQDERDTLLDPDNLLAYDNGPDNRIANMDRIVPHLRNGLMRWKKVVDFVCAIGIYY